MFMQKPAGLLLNRLTAGRDLSKPRERTRIAIIEGWLSIISNLLMFIIKFLTGLISGSLTLMADAIHTASDVSSSIILLIGFKVSSKGPDREHPFGHGRVEYLTTLAIAIILTGIGLSFAYASYSRLLAGTSMSPSIPAILVALISIIGKEFLHSFSWKAGQAIESEALLADAWHHRSDSLSSLLVVIAVGGAYLNLGLLDTVLGFVISGFLIYTGFDIARKSCHNLLGPAPAEKTKNEIMDSTLVIKGVLDAHDLTVHDYGIRKSVTIHIEVDGELSLNEAHEIAHTVEHILHNKHNCSAVVHLDPHNRDSAKKEPGIPDRVARINKVDD